MDRLDGPRAKLARAREHVASLSAEFEAWTESVATETRVDLGRKQVVVTATDVPTTPLRWSTILGDALHNYRSVLDHLAWQLAATNTPDRPPPRTVQFPIVSDQADWAAQEFRVADMSERHRRIVKGLQPFHRGFWMGVGPPRMPLEDLRDLSNVDKHRFIVLTTLGADDDLRLEVLHASGIRLGVPHFLVGPPIGPGTELLLIDIVELPDPHNFELQLSYTPSTYFALHGGPGAERVLNDIDEAVGWIVEVFAAEPALLRAKPTNEETAEDRERVSLKCLRARLPLIMERLDDMGRDLVVMAPNPYLPIGAQLTDLADLWQTELASAIRDPAIVQMADLVFESQAALEANGLVPNEGPYGVPAIQLVDAYPELVMRLMLAIGLLTQLAEGRLDLLTDMTVDPLTRPI